MVGPFDRQCPAGRGPRWRRGGGSVVRVAVIGAGIVGVTTAYEVVAMGHEVTVFERCGSVAAQASFANAGIVAPGYCAPWAAPGLPWKALRQLLSRHAPLRAGGPGVWAQWPWIWRWWRACRPALHRANRVALHQLALDSRARLLELTRALRLEYEQAPGFTVLLRSERDLARARGTLEALAALGVAYELIDAARCRQIEPGLNPDARLHAAIHLPQDGVGNCRQFAHLVKAEAQRLGASFRFETPISRLEPGSTPALHTEGGEKHEFDAIVVCAGAQANEVLARIGMRLPLAAIHGYSMTASVRHLDGHPDPGPRAALMDERQKVAIVRLGQRIRVAGGAEIGGRPDRQLDAPLRLLYRVLDDWFPGAAITRDAQQWKGARPMLPDGLPVLGQSGAPGIWLNLGHGGSGWALACGSARALATQLSGREAPLDLTRFAIARLR
jgi:D-amino-acid dehydrogenase